MDKYIKLFACFSLLSLSPFSLLPYGYGDLRCTQMEHNKERRFVCKYCSKRFPCGKSLGGHIRTHMNENSADSDEDEPDKLKLDENGGQSSYGLRENPKKNKRFVDQREMMAAQKQEQLQCCRECGKGFISLKALCGHMACHSEREKVLMDSQSDSEASSSPIRRRSKRPLRHQFRAATVVVNGKMGQSNSASFVNGNSSSVSGIEQEQEETALSLMMLSRDSSFKKSHNLLNSLAESSDNNSVILETKSSSGEHLKIMNLKNAAELYRKSHEILRASKLGVDNQLRSPEHNNVFLYNSDNSDSGYFRNGPKKTDSDGSVDGFLKARSEFNSSATKQDKEWFKEGGSGSGSGSGRSSTKYDLRNSRKIFPSSNRKKIKYDFTESVYDSGEPSLETYSCADTDHKIHRSNGSKAPIVATVTLKKASGTKKKSKGHECPICFRVFKSGQALGGHKRSHFIGNQEHRTVVIQHQVAEMHTLIDLNLPAPVE